MRESRYNSPYSYERSLLRSEGPPPVSSLYTGNSYGVNLMRLAFWVRMRFRRHANRRYLMTLAESTRINPLFPSVAVPTTIFSPFRRLRSVCMTARPTAFGP